MGPLKAYFLFKLIVTLVVAYIFCFLAFLLWIPFY